MTAPSRRGRRSGLSKARRAKLTGKRRGPYERAIEPKPTLKNPYAVALIRFLALSGWRSDEAQRLRWEHLDETRGVAILPDSKTGRTVRPLGRAALDALMALKETVGYPASNPFVFPGTKPNTSSGDVKHVWSDVRHAAGLTVTKHGLRHAFATTARWLGYGDHVIAWLLGHEMSASQTSRYGDVPEKQVQEAADRIAAYIGDRLSGVNPSRSSTSNE